MILITGGAFQGKMECAKDILAREGRTDPIWDGVTDYMKERMKDGMEPEAVEEEIEKALKLHPDMILITREIGCGIVPMDAFERRYREAHGRMCCRLAARAERVYRVSCGLAQCIKGGQ